MGLTFLTKIQDSKKWKNHIGLGMSFPTGGINERDVTPMSSDARLGYAMQNGTGTYDGFFLITNLNEFGKFKVGEQFFFKFARNFDEAENFAFFDILSADDHLLFCISEIAFLANPKSFLL